MPHQMIRQVKRVVTCSLLILTLFSIFEVSAQDLSANFENIEKIDVDALSDEQIKRIAEEIDRRGLTDTQLELAARSRGVSSLQIAKLKQRIAAVRSGITKSSEIKEINRLREVQDDNIQTSDLFATLADNSNKNIVPEERIFGMEMFRSKNLTFEPSTNIPTPKNYQLGVGDELLIDIWGASEQTYQLTVSPEGSIRISGIGPINVSGLTVEEASRKIKSRLKKTIFSNLGYNTYADISLGNLKSIKVNIVGEVQNQGTYVLSPFSSVFNALYAAGGPNENGSLRKIDHYRKGEKINTIDVYSFLINGAYTNTFLNDQDYLIVRPYSSRVQVVGQVKKQGYYEVLENESLTDLLNYAGGFTSKAYTDKITIRRNKDLKRALETVESGSYDNFYLKPGDKISVSSIIDRFENRVRIGGAVVKPGEFEFTKGMKLSQLLGLAEGAREDAFYARGSIVRLKKDMTLSFIAFDLNEVMSGKDIELQNEDYVEIKSSFDLRGNYQVFIDGEVRSPGSYTFVDSLTVEDLIIQANGFKQSAARSMVEVARRKSYNDSSDPSNTSHIFNFPISEDLSLLGGASDFVLKPFDLVVVRKSPYYEVQEIVEVQGEANFPGKYVIKKKDERISDLLGRAGGITSYGNIRGATLIRKTEYFAKNASASERIKRENLQSLAKRDSLLDRDAIELKRSESIGIDLGQIIKSPGSKYDLILKEGDILGIPKQIETVRLGGELLYPNTVRYDKNLSFKSYISQAGGFSDNAKRGKSYVINANGSVKRTKKVFWINLYPKVEPGAEVIVPEKPEKRRLSTTEFISIASGLGTIALIVNNLTRD